MDIWNTVVGFAQTGVNAAGAVFAIMGVIAYGKAKAEGSGPEQSKAIGQVIGGLLIIAAGTLLIPMLNGLFSY